MTTYAIILASGSGSRYGSGVPKQFIKIAGKTLLEHTVEIFEAAQNIDRVILIIPREYRKLTEEMLLYGSYKKYIRFSMVEKVEKKALI